MKRIERLNAMKYALLLLAALLTDWGVLSAAEPSAPLGEAEMNWPGIHYQITFIKRLPPDRLLVGVRVLAAAQAPPGGTLIGFPVVIPPGTDKRALDSEQLHPRPLSLASSVMVDDSTQQKYPALSPISPPGRKYLPGQVLGFLKPNQSLVMTVQFIVPPPPPDTPGQPPAKPTVSFLFTNAKSPIKNVTIPPPTTASN